jgi:hypothetical protein
MPKSDSEILNELRKHSTEELLAFRKKLRKMHTSQAWAIRFWILKILVSRSLFVDPEPGQFSQLTPDTDPTAFYEERDAGWYHLCDLPMHNHHIRFPFRDCNADTLTWESSYAHF